MTEPATKPKIKPANPGAEKLTPNEGDLVLMGNVAKRDFHFGTNVVPFRADVVFQIV